MLFIVGTPSFQTVGASTAFIFIFNAHLCSYLSFIINIIYKLVFQSEFDRSIVSTVCESPRCPSLPTRASCMNTEVQTGAIFTSTSSDSWATGWLWMNGRCLARSNSSAAFPIVQDVTSALKTGFNTADFLAGADTLTPLVQRKFGKYKCTSRDLIRPPSETLPHAASPENSKRTQNASLHPNTRLWAHGLIPTHSVVGNRTPLHEPTSIEASFSGKYWMCNSRGGHAQVRNAVGATTVITNSHTVRVPPNRGQTWITAFHERSPQIRKRRSLLKPITSHTVLKRITNRARQHTADYSSHCA